MKGRNLSLAKPSCFVELLQGANDYDHNDEKVVDSIQALGQSRASRVAQSPVVSIYARAHF